MKVLLALTCLLAFLALALSESASHRDVELLGDQLGVRDKREAARGDKKSLKKNGLRKKKRANKNNRKSASGDKKKMNKRSKKKGTQTKTKKKNVEKARKKDADKRGSRKRKRTKTGTRKRKFKGKNKKIKGNNRKNNKDKPKRNKKKRNRGNKKRNKGGKKGKKWKKKRNKQRRKQRGKKNRKQKGSRTIDGRNTTTCSDTTTVSSDCLEDAVDVLKYLRSQVRTFNRKFARIKSFNKTVGNKLGKKGVFEQTAKYLLLALGGNISSAACGETGSRSTNSRDKNTAVATYSLLNNCSAAIKAACTMPNTTLSDEDTSAFATCADTFNKTAVAADDCRTNSKYTSNGPAACTCWSKIVAGINKVKQSGACNTTDTNDGVKETKSTCMEVFSACRKAEDSAVQLVYTCGSGAVANSTKSTS